MEPVAESGYNISSAAWSMGNQFNSWLVPGQADDLYVISEERNRAASVSHLAGFTMDTTPIETEMAQLRTVVAEYGNGFLWAEDYDQWKADFRKKLETAGINTVIEEVQRQIDEWRVANGK